MPCMSQAAGMHQTLVIAVIHLASDRIGEKYRQVQPLPRKIIGKTAIYFRDSRTYILFTLRIFGRQRIIICLFPGISVFIPPQFISVFSIHPCPFHQPEIIDRTAFHPFFRTDPNLILRQLSQFILIVGQIKIQRPLECPFL